MRYMGLFLLMAFFSRLGLADDKVVQTFTGAQPLTTSAFTVQDKWEVRWDSPQVIAITVLAPDGSIIAGSAGSMKGSLYEPKGGTYTLQISENSSPTTSTWNVSVVELGPPQTGTKNATVSTDYVPPVPSPTSSATNIVSAPVAPSAVTTPAAPAVTAPATVPLPPIPAIPLPAVSLTVTKPAAPPASKGDLTEAESHAIVVIRGDYEEGTGFLVKTDFGPAVITNIHVISANPNVKILTTTGEEIKTIGLKGASDRDLAMFLIKDNNYSYLDLATDIANTVQNGDEDITPGNSEGGMVVLNTKGKVVGIGPERIEFDNPIYHGNSGGPVFHTASGKVIGVVTEAEKVDTSDDLDKASFNNKASAIAATMRYFGLRIDTVPKWETYDWDQFLTQTTFLKNFHDQSRTLDSYINGQEYEKEHIATGADDEGPPDSKYYEKDQKIQQADDTFNKMDDNSDKSQHLDADRQMVLSLDGIADTDMTAIQDSSNFYSFLQTRAQEEVDYRKALRDEIDKFGDNIGSLGH
jgi:hypothetical protein